MNNTKVYTAQELREAAISPTYVGHKDADAALAYANYILRGDTGKEENA